MTRKHFEAIATILSERSDQAAVRNMAHDLAAYFKIINPAFDTIRFLEACGIGTGVRA